MKKQQVKTKLPGPKSQPVLEMDKQYISPSYPRSYPMVVAKGEGMYLEDPDGNRFLDFIAGIATVTTGHCHPDVVKAIKRQAETLIHTCGTDFYYQQQAAVAKKLSDISPGAGEKRVFLTNSGTESVEAGLKLARWKTRRPLFLAFHNSFHGRSMGSLSLTCTKTVQRKGFFPLVPGVHHIPFAYCYRCAYGQKYGSCDFECVKILEDVLFRGAVPPEEVAALITEPIQGEGGYVVPPPEFFKKIKDVLDKYEILFMVDEIQSGMGRTGKLFAIEHWGVVPDIVALAKGLASGMPLGACIAPHDMMDWPPGAHANTFGGNPISCVAALETIRLIEEGLMENAAKQGQRLLDGLLEIQKNHRLIDRVNGKGLMVGLEVVKDKGTKEHALQERTAIVTRAWQKGLICFGCGVSNIRFSPPLIADQEHIDTALEIFEEALSEVEKEM
jgi:4-aminobutyrate aminotransferase